MTGTWYLVPVIYLYCRAVLIHLAGTAMNLERIRSNLSKTKNIPPKALIFSDFFAYLCHVIDDFCLS